jgi:Peptidase family S41
MRCGIKSLLAASLVVYGGLGGLLQAGATPEESGAPDFKEVYDLVRAHLAGTSEGQLNEAAVQGLMAKLRPRVALVTNGAAAKAAAEAPLVKKASVFEGDMLYVRVGRVGEGLAEAIKSAWVKPGTTNKLKGLVLDLRYADGSDYAAVPAASDVFVRKEQSLLNWGNGMVQSKPDTAGIKVPVAVLVNAETTGAAEALAAVLRETGSGLILGSRTAGQAMVAQEFPLKNGEHLRIATAPVQLGDGSAISEQGVKPDILVEVGPAAERVFYANAYAAPEKTNLLAGAGLSATNQAAGTNQVGRRPRFNEAELVRERREGVSEADLTAMRDHEVEKPTVQDPALARALDLLRGLALVRQSR